MRSGVLAGVVLGSLAVGCGDEPTTQPVDTPPPAPDVPEAIADVEEEDIAFIPCTEDMPSCCICDTDITQDAVCKQGSWVCEGESFLCGSQGCDGPSADVKEVEISPLCEVAEIDPNACCTEPTLSSLETTYFATTCTFSLCHNSTYRAGGLNLSEGQSYSALINVPAIYAKAEGMHRVTPGDPDNSFLVRKVDFITAGPGIGLSMPPGIPDPFSTDCAIPALRQWIEEGAPDN